MNQPVFEAAKSPGSAHHQLGLLLGHWRGSVQTWFEPGVLADQSPMQGTIRPVLGGRFVLFEYEGTMQDNPLQGMMIIGYHLPQKRYEIAWVDSFHMATGIMFLESDPQPGGIAATGHYADPSGGPPWGWRTEITLIDPTRLVITAYNISPQGEETKATEASISRYEP